jgi:hypothetical protein
MNENQTEKNVRSFFVHSSTNLCDRLTVLPHGLIMACASVAAFSSKWHLTTTPTILNSSFHADQHAEET